MKFTLSEAILREDDAVFDIEEEASFGRSLESSKPALAYLQAEDWDITDKTDAFKTWIKHMEQEVIKENYQVTSTDIFAAADDFITEVLGFSLYGPEMEYGLAGYAIEMVFDKPIDNTSGVLPPIPYWDNRDKKLKKHIVHKTMNPTILVAWHSKYARQMGAFPVAQLLLDGVSADTIIGALKHVWLFEEKRSDLDLTKFLRKTYLDYLYAKNHKDFNTVKNIKEKLTKFLDDVRWELICRDEGSDLKNIIDGKGFNENSPLFDWLDKPGFRIESFKVTDLDL